MKLLSTILVLSAAVTIGAFAPHSGTRNTQPIHITHMGTPGMDTSGNTWKPDSEKMGVSKETTAISTDTGDYFPEGYNPEEEIAFTSGMMGSQANLAGDNRGGPQLPGLENLGADAMVAGGITVDPNIPPDMEFIPSSVPDGEVSFSVASTGTAGSYDLLVRSPCMTFEDYYAAFSKDSHPSLSVSPSTGRLDRRSGEPTLIQITCNPNGQGGVLTGNLVINLPDDNSKICYKVSVNSM